MAPKAEEKAKAKAGVVKTIAKKAEPKKEEEVKDEEVKDEEMKEEIKEEETEKPNEPEKPKELEEDAAKDSRKKVAADDVALNFAGATLNVLPCMDGKLLRCFSDGGFQYLLAGIKSTAGLKAGRYAFEAKIIECLNPSEPPGTQGPAPKQLVRVGFSTAASSVYLAESSDYCCFDSEGYFSHGRKRSKVGQNFSFGDTVSLVLNLDKSSPNADTVSIFKNGVRASKPQALPETLKGKTLFPAVAYRNVALQLNLGPSPLVALPFSCRMPKDAAAADVEVKKPAVPKDGKHEVMFPVGIPGEGIFEWADQFLAKNPTFTELSDRKIMEWASKSGVMRPKVSKGSKDNPEMNFGLPLLDDLSVRKVLAAIAPTLNRDFLVMELKSNLLAEQRKEFLTLFRDFKTTAVVAAGEPDAAYKAKVQQDMLALKKKQAEEDKKKKTQEAERQKLLEEKRKKAEEAKKKRIADQKKKAGKEDEVEETEEKAEEEEKGEEKMDEDAKMEEEPEEIELTEEEKKVWHKKTGLPDLTQAVMTKFYSKFSLPTKAEGFTEVKYVWGKQDACDKLLTAWVYDRKMNVRVDVKPGKWFEEELSKWNKQLSAWKAKQAEWKNPLKKKALLAKLKEAKEKKEKAEDKEAGGEEGAEAEAAEKTEETAEEKTEEKAEKEEEKEPEIDAEDLDVFAVDDVTDIGSGEPLFANFGYEDWTLLALRIEFHLMMHSWKKDLDDPERPSFKDNHIAHYYNKYFKKEFKLTDFGVSKMKDIVDLLHEAVTINEDNGYLEIEVEEDMPFHEFLKVTEEQRRERQRKIEAGDETAQLQFRKTVQTPVPVAGAAGALGYGVKRPLTPVATARPGFAAPRPYGSYGPAAAAPRAWGSPYPAVRPAIRPGVGTINPAAVAYYRAAGRPLGM